jgi:hypothetical protein
MKKTIFILVILLIATSLFFGGCKSTPTPTTIQAPQETPAPSPEPTPASEEQAPATEPIAAETEPTMPELKPNITLPTNKCAFYGRIMWGDNPVTNGTVIADTDTPAAMIRSDNNRRFTVNTDDKGDYILIVEPDKYYIGCMLPGSQYISYKKAGLTFLPSGLWGVLPRKIADGEFALVNLEALDWSIRLISPGKPESPSILDKLNKDNNVTTNTTPSFLWHEYDWNRYSANQQEHGYYKISITLGWSTMYNTEVEKGESKKTFYIVVNPLEPGEYKWEVRAFSKSGKEIAGTEQKFYFYVP